MRRLTPSPWPGILNSIYAETSWHSAAIALSFTSLAVPLGAA